MAGLAAIRVHCSSTYCQAWLPRGVREGVAWPCATSSALLCIVTRVVADLSSCSAPHPQKRQAKRAAGPPEVQVAFPTASPCRIGFLALLFSMLSLLPMSAFLYMELCTIAAYGWGWMRAWNIMDMVSSPCATRGLVYVK